MDVIGTSIGGVHILEVAPIFDHRGAFARLFCKQELVDVVGERQIVQVNYSRTTEKGAVRGMHFQFAPFSEMKVVRCVKGRVWDVALDLRKNSRTFLKWHAEELSQSNYKALAIPEGCAHGFQALEEDSELLYFHTAFYNKNAEGGVNVRDPAVSIAWPLPIRDLSARDANFPFLPEEFSGVEV